MFKASGIPFHIVVEPQEYDLYCEALGEDCVLALPFSNLGLGSYPARNWIWEHSIEAGHKKHWIFDDNIRAFYMLTDGKRTKMEDGKIAINKFEEFTDQFFNIGVCGFNYMYFVTKDQSKPFAVNTHVYSSLLIRNDMPFRWRLKYNEDVDLCLQVLSNGYCTLLFNLYLIDKISTTVKLKGGNQDELYKNNDQEKKYQKSKSLEMVWPQYVKVVNRFDRWHHQISWKKHFKQKLIKG